MVHQPANDDELVAAQKALLSCPTSSIGTRTKQPMQRALAAYPELIENDVYFCGFTSESSFGALSYFIKRPQGNVLIDSPRFSGPLVKNLEALGGVSLMLLTHRDDVADHDKFREHFGCERVLHKDDVTRGTREVERQPDGDASIAIDADITMIPVPGHTRGHAVFLYRNRFLFTGDHLAWSVNRGHLYAFRSACWYSWPAQIQSMRKLFGYEFEWVLPGHGRAIQLPAARMRESLETCVRWMEKR